MLSNWDLRYDVESRGATLFENFYGALLTDVFGERLFGVETWSAVTATTNLSGAYFHVFDEALLADDEWCFDGRGRESVFTTILTEVLSVPEGSVAAWGAARQVILRNLFFGEKLPRLVSRLLRIDYGPIVLPGGRATIAQGQVFKTHGRNSTFAPSYRSVCDLGTDELHTALCGGPSGRIFAKLYTSGIGAWRRFEYKTLKCGE
jgi:penicillin amidase